MVCVGAGGGVGVEVGTDGGVVSPIHPADIKTATIVTMAIKLAMDFFFVVFIVLAPVSYPVLNRPAAVIDRPNVRSASNST